MMSPTMAIKKYFQDASLQELKDLIQSFKSEEEKIAFAKECAKELSKTLGEEVVLEFPTK